MEYNNKQLLNYFISSFANYDFNNKQEHFDLPFPKINVIDDLFRSTNKIVMIETAFKE